MIGWIAIGVTLLVVGAAGAAIAGLGQWAQRDALDPESFGAAGTRALAEVLRAQGVEVRVTRQRDEAVRLLGAERATLALADPAALSDEAVLALAAAAVDTVLLDPRSRTLDLLLHATRPAGEAPIDVVDPSCALPDARRAGPVVPGAVYTPGSAADAACYPVGDAYGLVVSDDGARRVSALDGRAMLANDRLADNGNAALGVNLLGRNPLVVWYVPTLADTDIADTDPSLGDLTPPWVSPVIVLALAAGLAAAIWRGRRFGPLVAERMPVTVRASETTEGRARLYAHSRDAGHAADQLRLAALPRLARLLGLSASASAGEIADAAAARIGADRGAVRGVLFDIVPEGDADLVALHTRLQELERAVARAARPERTP
ncbi:DUF4350 domain-containing protein [Microbacterium hominis]|uniref:DUF4350 domain-containing protein n=1 Tax=Microbacterium hominis TaxID=162426 RepID=A0A7D4TTA8_9MICO|nr:DUF4350 domain-containing protein [Microbacterium hominis]